MHLSVKHQKKLLILIDHTWTAKADSCITFNLGKLRSNTRKLLFCEKCCNTLIRKAALIVLFLI